MNTDENGSAGQPPASGPGPGETVEATNPDAPLIALEQERADLQAQANVADGDEAAETLQDQVTRVEHEIADAPALGPVGIAIKLRRLERMCEDGGGAPWDQQNFDTALYALDRMGDVSLILWEQEYNRLWNTDYKTETEAGQEALDRACEEWNGIYDKIVETLAHTPAGVAVKARMLRHNLRQGDNREKDNRAWDSCLTSLVNMADTPTPAAQVLMPNAKDSNRHTDNRPHADESIIQLWQERGRLTAEADEILAFDRDDSDTDKRINTLDDKATEIEKRIAIMTPNGPSGWAVQVALLALWLDRGLRADKLDLQLVARLGAYFLGTVSPLPNVTGSGDKPDAALFVLEAEMKAAYDGLAADPGGNDEHQVWYDRIDAAEKATLATPAQTAAGVLAKLRMAAHYQNPKPDPDHDEVFDGWTRHIIEEAQRIGGAS